MVSLADKKKALPKNGASIVAAVLKHFKDYILKEEPGEEVGIIYVNGVCVLSDGNVLLVIGPPKSRKTLLVCALVRGTGLRTAYVDSEQGKRHSWRTGKFIPVADVYHMRGEGPDEIMRVINEIVSCGEYRLLVIDNMRDLIADFNNVEKSGELELFLKKVSERIPTIAIIHENKTSKKGQGHAGYGAEKIAQTVIRVSLVDVEDPGKGSFVECVHSRDEPFKRAFLSMEGMLSNDNLIQAGGRGMLQEDFFRQLGDVEYTHDELLDKLSEIFGIMKSTARNSLTAIRKACPNAILERKEGKRKFYYTSLTSK